LATRPQTLSPCLRSAVLGHGFPLGLYTVCTLQLSKAISFEPLLLIPRYFIFIALTAWLAIFVGLIHSLLPWKTKSRRYGS